MTAKEFILKEDKGYLAGDYTLNEVIYLMNEYAKIKELEQCTISRVSESFSKSDLLDLGGWFDGSPEFVEEVVSDWLNAR
ncbi:hypothetical protein [Psychroflexus salis]|uniref:Uncharacterized protein n=1 Tax=Psychroflexus salis TaxID=1526574 RepID=A0A917ECR2_9FLAO|nr:hypothetical protein [Psychroflexus salis]GGE22786.1 hypothetical protein GCM10010831_24610 [Psychroflexus salis]